MNSLKFLRSTKIVATVGTATDNINKIKSLIKSALFLAWICELNLNSLSIFLRARYSIFVKIFKDLVWNSKYWALLKETK